MNLMSQTYTLLIWENIPEETKFYVIPAEVADPFNDLLAQAHNKFSGTDDDNPGLLFVLSAINEYCDDYHYVDQRGIFSQFLVPTETPIDGKLITKVYLTGLIL